MNITLSPRLQKIADFVPEQHRVIDVGTDHAYITNSGQVMGADLTQKQRDKIFYKNALNLLDRNYRL